MPKYIKILIPLLLILEVTIHFKYGINSVFLLLKYLQCGLLIYWIYQSFKGDIDFSLKLILIRFFIPLYLIPKFYYSDKNLRVNLELFFNLIDVVCLLLFFLMKTIPNFKVLSRSTLRKIFVSYIIVPILFFLVVLFPYLNQYFITLGTIYLLVLIFTAIISVFFSDKPIVKLYVSISVFCLIFSTGLGAISLFLGGFRGNVEINIVITMLSNIFLNLGLTTGRKYADVPSTKW
ncbi:MAG: hypothetical protein MUF45_09245 [Spirosomaceae bacterium]|jgi:hypothetical protein|nr:hypothetical protein [Spirosomataceae bacterium]